MKKILIPEELSKDGISKLSEKYDVLYLPDCSRETLLEEIKDANALIIRSATKVDQELLDASTNLEVIGRAGVGVDNIDVKAATKKGIVVANAPLSNIVSAAEHAIALLLSTARHVPQAHSDLIVGKWNRSSYNGIELSGKTLGILGFGRVGELVAKRMQAFDMRVIVFDPYTTIERAKDAGVAKVDTLEELIKQSDFLSIHTPKTKDTINIVNKELLSNAKPNLIIINAARGGIVNEDDLYDVLADGTISGAGLDVYNQEPTTDSKLFSLPNVVATPHLGASTNEAQDNASEAICEQVDLALAGLFVPFALNIDAESSNSSVQAFLGLTEIIGQFVGGLSYGEEISKIIFEAAGHIAQYDCSILTLSAIKGVLNSRKNQNVSFVNANTVAKEKGIEIEEKVKSTSIYINRVRVKVVTKSGREFSASGAFSGIKGEPRIVEIDRHTVDVPPYTNMLVVINKNIPGMVGVVGTILGENKLNVSDMSLSKSEDGKLAIMVFALDSNADDVAKILEAVEGIVEVYSLVRE